MKFGDMEVFFQVIVGGVKYNLLGEDFISHFQCNFDHAEREFVICKGDIVDDSGSGKSRCKRLARVALADTTDIMPECEMIVPANFKDKPLTGDGILVPDTVFTVKHGLMLARLLVNSDQSRVCARILNPSKEVVRIQKGTVRGLFEPLVAIEECDVNDTTQDLVSYISETDSNKDLPLNLQETYIDGSQNLSDTQQVQFQEVLIKNQTVFARPGEVGRTSFGTHKIKLTDETPIKEPPRRVPLFNRHILEKEVSRLDCNMVYHQVLLDKSDKPKTVTGYLSFTKDHTKLDLLQILALVLLLNFLNY